MRGTRDVRKEERPRSENLLTIPQTDRSRTHDQHQIFKQMKYGYEQIKKKNPLCMNLRIFQVLTVTNQNCWGPNQDLQQIGVASEDSKCNQKEI